MCNRTGNTVAKTETKPPLSERVRLICGWTAVAGSTGFGCFWAFWGVIENFHEGWYGDSALWNLGLMLVQYLSPMLLFVAMGFVSILMSDDYNARLTTSRIPDPLR